MLSRSNLKNLLKKWNQAWDRHDLDGVMQLFHEDVLFDNWTGARARGRDNLEKAWAGWFENHGGFRFTGEDTFIDETEQKVLYRWQLDWPSMERGFEGKHESRRGVDVLHFKDEKIIEKLTYCKTSIEIAGQRVSLTAKV
ncbi:MAG: nuclear transport factor 2 family protein [Deltaproteobacteria bacterium]|nr:nuclear transport factor 2 family protein [Deltaproteobacteria bacterium]